MKIFTITKEHTNEKNEYIGPDLSDFDGHIEADENLRCVRFKSLKTTGYIWFKAGSGIEAGSGIKAGWGIEAGEGIEAGWGIEAGLSIKCTVLASQLRIFAGLCIWRDPNPDEMVIECERLEKGTICFGNLVEKGKK